MDKQKALTQILTILFQAVAGSNVMVNFCTRYTKENGAVLTSHDPEVLPKVVGIFANAAELYDIKAVAIDGENCLAIGDLYGTITFVSTPRPQDVGGFYDHRFEWSFGVFEGVPVGDEEASKT